MNDYISYINRNNEDNDTSNEDIVEKNLMLNENMQSLINNLSDIKIKETVL